MKLLLSEELAMRVEELLDGILQTLYRNAQDGICLVVYNIVK